MNSNVTWALRKLTSDFLYNEKQYGRSGIKREREKKEKRVCRNNIHEVKMSKGQN